MDSPLSVFESPREARSCLEVYRTCLRVWPVRHERRYIRTSFGITHVILSGPENGPAIVLLHGLFATAFSWHKNVEALSHTHRVCVVDVIGEANESTPSCPITSLDMYARWFVELMDALDLRRFSLVGNSYGAFTASYYAMRMPERIERLVLIGPAATFHPMPRFYLHFFLPIFFFMLLPWLPGRESAMRRTSAWMHAGVPPDPDWNELFIRLLMHGRMTSQVLPRLYSRQELSLIQAPTLLLLGDRERIYPVGDAIASARNLMPGIHVKVVPAAHHVSALANPDAVNTMILEFLGDGTSTHAERSTPEIRFTSGESVAAQAS